MNTVSDIAKLNLSTQRWDKLQNFYRDKNVTVTGGASFIGSHVVEIVLELGGG